ncbi:hypothetical protein [Methanosalsum natronophilum]|uniref:Uncharacterized protein n=1 Tax=Methanosalsum natronophilum TaxID=768733 RepID=A0A3R7VZ63_9EURY|nr:hypothetical protein [Methanosalsum natronophilum]MCS3924410.1 hypothetical protein [Methanosalsum natronophilum]RQD91338.1 MAG: hypothetical protein D5R95_01155 [Methanosalsum natronophilum]
MKVKVLVENLCTDAGGTETIYKKHDIFEIGGKENINKLGNSIEVINELSEETQNIENGGSSATNRKRSSRKGK